VGTGGEVLVIAVLGKNDSVDLGGLIRFAAVSLCGTFLLVADTEIAADSS
jgi:hypothetical protein